MNHDHLKNTIQWSLLVLVALMPFHAFLSVWMGHLFGHQAAIQAWKEALLLLLAGATLMLLWREPKRLQQLRRPWVVAALVFAAIAVLVTALNRPPLTAIAFGLKTDLEFILAALIAAVAATPTFVQRLVATVLAGAALVCAFALAQIFLLPPDFLVHFGYGPDTIVPYQTLASGALRFGATLGGPNQLGTYLMLPLCLSLALALRRRGQWQLFGLIGAGIITLIHTYSRGAWIGAIVASVATIVASAPARARRPVAWSIAALGLVALLALPLAISQAGPLQSYILHSDPTAPGARSSDSEHLTSLRYGLTAVLAAPFGHGLGSAGPATFHAGNLVIIENYFLQISYETGLLGLAAFLALLTLLIARLARLRPPPIAALPTAATLIGVSVVALVLPAWTDSTTALITWTVAGALTGSESARA